MEDIDVDELIAELNALRIRVARLEADRDRENATRETTVATETAAFGDLRVGDRVQIKNRVRKQTFLYGFRLQYTKRYFA